MSDTYARLAERFPASDHRTRRQAGRELTYLPGERVISRLNEVLGFSWSFRVVGQGVTDVEAWVLGELTATIDGREVVRQQYGNQELVRGQYPTTDLFKSAATDALKKCATTIGVGLYLYDEDERREVEAEMRAERQAPKGGAATSAARPGTTASRSASTPTAPTAGGTSSSTTVAAAQAGASAEPVPLKTKAELAADLRRGLEYARTLGLDPAEVDPARLNRAQLEEVIASLREQCRAAQRAVRAGAS